MILQCVLVGQKIIPTRDDAKDLSRTRLASSLVENIIRTPRTQSNATFLYHSTVKSLKKIRKPNDNMHIFFWFTQYSYKL